MSEPQIINAIDCYIRTYKPRVQNKSPSLVLLRRAKQAILDERKEVKKLSDLLDECDRSCSCEWADMGNGLLEEHDDG